MNELPARGDLRWALVPHTPQAPFRLSDDATRHDFGAVRERLRRSAPRTGGSLELQASIRPVVLLHGWASAANGTFLVVRTKRLESLPASVQGHVRAGGDPLLVPLQGRSAGKERAAMPAMVARVHASALDDAVIGRATDDELRRIADGMAGAFELDLDGLVHRRVSAVLADLGLA